MPGEDSATQTLNERSLAILRAEEHPRPRRFASSSVYGNESFSTLMR